MNENDAVVLEILKVSFVTLTHADRHSLNMCRSGVSNMTINKRSHQQDMVTCLYVGRVNALSIGSTVTCIIGVWPTSLVMVGRRGRQASAIDPEYETRMGLAICDLANGTYKTIIAAANAHKVRPLC